MSLNSKRAMLFVVACIAAVAGSVAWAQWYGGTPETTWSRSGTVASSLTVIGDPIGRYGKGSYVSVEIKNTGAAALTDFTVEYRYHSTGDWLPILGGTDWGTASATLPLFSNTLPNTLAAGGTSHVVLQVYGADALRFAAQTGTSTTVTVKGTFQTSPTGN